MPGGGETPLEVEEARLKVGAKVEARFGGGARWFKGRVARAHDNGTFDVEYEDGDRESHVSAELIRPLEESVPPVPPRKRQPLPRRWSWARTRASISLEPGRPPPRACRT
jgi:hypothetical protein